VSVVIPCYGKLEYTLRCLASIAANPPTASIEVIVVDDATADASTAASIRLLQNETKFP
jgi:glycosyltransferase involved in cell wall biosynthesis